MQLEVVEADITTLAVDAIVNAANTRMRGGGGVDGAIHRAAGPGLLAECVERFPRGLGIGEVGWTTGHQLPARWVVHVVGPIHGRAPRSRLVSCYTGALAVGDELRAAYDLPGLSMAFPLVSAGSYGWPKADAVAAQVDTLATTPTSVTRAVLCAFDPRTADLLRAAVARLAAP